MARKSNSNIPVQKQLSVNEMTSAVTKIERRLNDLKNFNIEVIEQGDDPNLAAIEHKIDQLLLDIFGAESAQYDRYWDIKDLYHPSLRVGYTPSAQDIRNAIKPTLPK